MEQQQGVAEKPQPGWKIAVGIIGFIVGLVVLLWALKALLGM